MSKKKPKAIQSRDKKDRDLSIALIMVLAQIGIALIPGIIPKQQSGLEIILLTSTHEAELDVRVRNRGSTEVLITELTVSIVEDTGDVLIGLLRPSARYELPIVDLKEGEARSIRVSHVVGAHKVDRFLVALQTTAVLKIKLTITYNGNQTVSDIVWLWGYSGNG